MLEKKIWVLLYIGNTVVMHKKSYCTRKELKYSVNASFKQGLCCGNSIWQFEI